jgi:hypothetical protein
MAVGTKQFGGACPGGIAILAGVVPEH